MMYIMKQTHGECVAMYMRCKKRELAEMLANRSALDDAQRWVKVPEVLETKPSDTAWTPPWPIVTTIG